MNIIFRNSDVVFVIRKGTTTNDKICANPNEVIIQTYTYSRAQFEYVLNSIKILKNGVIKSIRKRTQKAFFGLANTNCLDCVFNQYGKCYTHKYNQYAGFISQIKSIVARFGSFDAIPYLSNEMTKQIVYLCDGKYVRFGTYGEPSLLPINLVADMANVSRTFTGYTHQWRKPENAEFSQWLMASTHSLTEVLAAEKLGFRCFNVIPKNGTKLKGFIHCPASKEMGKSISCSMCKLCGGTTGTKSKRHTAIFDHAK